MATQLSPQNSTPGGKPSHSPAKERGDEVDREGNEGSETVNTAQMYFGRSATWGNLNVPRGALKWIQKKKSCHRAWWYV